MVEKVTVKPAEATKVLGQNVVQDKNPEALKADLSAARGSSGDVPASPTHPIVSEEPPVVDNSLPKPKGVRINPLTGAEEPVDSEYTARYVHGSKYVTTDAEWADYLKIAEELNVLQDDRGINDIPLNAEYWTKKAELDALVAGFRTSVPPVKPAVPPVEEVPPPPA